MDGPYIPQALSEVCAISIRQIFNLIVCFSSNRGRKSNNLCNFEQRSLSHLILSCSFLQTITTTFVVRYVMLSAIWCRLYNFKKPATLLKVSLVHARFSRFLNCKNGTKLRKVSHILAEGKQLVDFLVMSKSTLRKWCKMLGYC